MEFRFSKEFLIYPGETNFDDVWEKVCCKILNIEKRTNNIYRRIPPESGVDLYSPDDKIAYQCKSTDNADCKGHNLTKIVKSYESALQVKNELNWDKYCLCLNYDLSGLQERNLRKALPDVEILNQSYWLIVCKNYQPLVYENFRQLLPIYNNLIIEKIEEIYYEQYAEKLKSYLDKYPYEISVFSNKSQNIYKMKVADEFSIKDLINILTKAWNLPGQKYFSGCNFGLSHSILYNNEFQPINKTLKEIGINQESIVTLWSKIQYSESGNSGRFMQLTVLPNPDEGMKKYEELVKNAFYEYDNMII